MRTTAESRPWAHAGRWLWMKYDRDVVDFFSQFLRLARPHYGRHEVLVVYPARKCAQRTAIRSSFLAWFWCRYKVPTDLALHSLAIVIVLTSIYQRLLPKLFPVVRVTDRMSFFSSSNIRNDATACGFFNSHKPLVYCLFSMGFPNHVPIDFYGYRQHTPTTLFEARHM